MGRPQVVRNARQRVKGGQIRCEDRGRVPNGSIRGRANGLHGVGANVHRAGAIRLPFTLPAPTWEPILEAIRPRPEPRHDKGKIHVDGLKLKWRVWRCREPRLDIETEGAICDAKVDDAIRDMDLSQFHPGSSMKENPRVTLSSPRGVFKGLGTSRE